MKNFEKQFSDLLINEPITDDRLRTLRTKAFENFTQTGLPTKKWEEWQFTDFRRLSKEEYRLAKDFDLPSISSKIPGKISNFYTLIFINGHYQPQLSQIPDTISVITGADYLKSNPNVFSIDNESSEWISKSNPFVSLNTSMMNSGLPIRISENSNIEKPLQIIYLTTDTTDKLMNHPRFDIHVGKNSKITILEHYVGSTNVSYLTNAVSRFNLAKNSQLSHIRLQEEDYASHHIGFTSYNIEADSLLKSSFITDGALLCRNDIKINFTAQGSHAQINGLSITKDNQHHDKHIIVNHSNSECQSDQLFKFVLSGDASGVFNGKVVVGEDTKSTNANQSNKNLVLSPSAVMNANPQLEIYAEDVKCSHGSTTGQIDAEALFYLRSRGLSYDEANRLILNGFISDILEKINNEEIKLYINDTVSKKIRSMI
tara:strand:- start:1350 stop:2636 length:1287 start_codon:yes stop_codon:yes gene_type:complete